MPFVIVPVLSLNRMFRLPAVSMPIGFLTSTLCFNIVPVLTIRTSEIIRGNPSGTAQTTITIASVSASITSLNISTPPIAK